MRSALREVHELPLAALAPEQEKRLHELEDVDLPPRPRCFEGRKDLRRWLDCNKDH